MGSNPSSTLTSPVNLSTGFKRPSLHPVHTQQMFLSAYNVPGAVHGLSWPQFLYLPNGNNGPHRVVGSIEYRFTREA